MLKKGGDLIKLCNHRDDQGRCQQTALVVVDREYLSDVCAIVNQGSPNEKVVRISAYPMDRGRLCYFHRKKELGLFNTQVKDGERYEG